MKQNFIIKIKTPLPTDCPAATLCSDIICFISCKHNIFSDDAELAIVVAGENPYAESNGDKEAEDLILPADDLAVIEKAHVTGHVAKKSFVSSNITLAIASPSVPGSHASTNYFGGLSRRSR